MTKVILPLTAELLKSRLHYNPDTGIFTRIVLSGGQKPGTIAGTLHHKGYIFIRVGGKKYYAHQLAWLYMTGELVPQIDHKDRVRHNNKWNNLRAADNFLNAQNIGYIKSNKTGFLGVTARFGKYIAQIGITENGKKKKIHLGLFNTPELAHSAYLSAKRQLHPGCTI